MKTPKTWTPLQLHGTKYWFRGIYKITSYRSGEYLAFYLPPHLPNWGDFVSPPPDQGKHNRCWKTLKAAKAACAEHEERYDITIKALERAKHLQDKWCELAKEAA